MEPSVLLVMEGTRLTKPAALARRPLALVLFFAFPPDARIILIGSTGLVTGCSFKGKIVNEHVFTLVKSKIAFAIAAIISMLNGNR
ncbi:UNVERIFIED_CONTAM: hypothetical protein ABIC26_000318 [Paenibacillus sp. PvR008]